MTLQLTIAVAALLCVMLAGVFGFGLNVVAGYPTRQQLPSPVTVWAAVGDFTLAQAEHDDEPRLYRYRLPDELQGVRGGTVLRRDGDEQRWKVARPAMGDGK